MPWLVGEVERPGGDAGAVRLIVERLEKGFAQGPPLVDELVAVSFLESLPRVDEPGGAALREFLGPACRAHVERYRL